MVREDFGEHCLDRTTISEKLRLLKAGWVSDEGGELSGQPSTSKTKENGDKILALIHEDSHRTIYQLVDTTGIVKNGVFWDVMQCGSCKNRRFGET
jgi:hypothetical protein